jgi:hypothetical protein
MKCYVQFSRRQDHMSLSFCLLDVPLMVGWWGHKVHLCRLLKSWKYLNSRTCVIWAFIILVVV